MPIFELIQRAGRVPERDCLRTFNMGIGMMLVVAEREVERVTAFLKSKRERFWTIGRIVKGRRGVTFIR